MRARVCLCMCVRVRRTESRACTRRQRLARRNVPRWLRPRRGSSPRAYRAPAGGYHRLRRVQGVPLVARGHGALVRCTVARSGTSSRKGGPRVQAKLKPREVRPDPRERRSPCVSEAADPGTWMRRPLHVPGLPQVGRRADGAWLAREARRAAGPRAEAPAGAEPGSAAVGPELAPDPARLRAGPGVQGRRAGNYHVPFVVVPVAHVFYSSTGGTSRDAWHVYSTGSACWYCHMPYQSIAAHGQSVRVASFVPSRACASAPARRRARRRCGATRTSLHRRPE